MGPPPNAGPPPAGAFDRPGAEWEGSGYDTPVEPEGFDILATFQAMSKGWKVFCIASLVTVLATLFPWTRVRVFLFWYDAGGGMRILVFLAAASSAALPWFRMRTNQRATQRNLALAGGALAGLCLLFTLAGLVQYLRLAGIGMVLSLLATGAMVFGAYLVARDEGLF